MSTERWRASRVAEWLTAQQGGQSFPREIVTRFARAAEWRRRVEAGEVVSSQVPAVYRAPMANGFPRGTRLPGVSELYFNPDEIKAWWQTQVLEQS